MLLFETGQVMLKQHFCGLSRVIQLVIEGINISTYLVW